MLLIDTDMLVLHAAAGTLPQVVRRLGYRMADARRLAAASHQIRKGRGFRDAFGTAVLERVLPDVEPIEVIAPVDDVTLLDQLNRLMDPGEALLFATAVVRPGSLLCTGAKRAIQALAAYGPADCVAALQGTVVTLEAVLWCLLQQMGAGALQDAYRVAASHRTLRVMLSETAAGSDAACAASIRSYYRDIASTAGGLLYNPDPHQLGC